ncbi:MAG: hypothetical protein ACKPKO_16340, partial [Candidatus Fonsibacter sp.]
VGQQRVGIVGVYVLWRCINSSLMYLKPFVRDASAYRIRMKRHLPVATISLVYIMGSLDALVSALRLPLGPLLVLLGEGGVASVFELEELGVLVGVEYIALMGIVGLLLEHPVVWYYPRLGPPLVVVDRRPPQLF